MKDIDFVMGLHDFMRANVPLDTAGKAKLHDFVTFAREGARPGDTQADFCLDSACTHVQPDKLATLVDDYGANVHAYTDLMSDNDPKQKIRTNLLDTAIESYNLRPDSDRSAAGKKRLEQTVEFLLQRGVSAAPNADPREGAAAYAYALAYPDYEAKGFDAGIWAAFGRAADPASAGKDGFREPYELIRKYQPDAVARLEKALHVHSQAPNDNAAATAGGTAKQDWKKLVQAILPGR